MKPDTVGELRGRLYEAAEGAARQVERDGQSEELVLVPLIEARAALEPWGDDDPVSMVPESIMRDVRSKLAKPLVRADA